MAEPGDRIASHVIERRLGAGGMGEVYLAFDEKLERKVAIKLLPEGRALDRSARLRMLREARSASALHHPGIVTIFDVDEDEGLTYIVMEYVDGETLAELVARRGKLPPAEAVALVVQAARAIDAAHHAGVLHRDIKSANLMVTRDGVVKVLDFGLSKRTGPTTATPAPSEIPDEPVDANAETAAPDATANPITGDIVTIYGARMGTPGWSALELVEGEPASEKSDVFSLGVLLYQLVTGEVPFQGTTWGDLRRQQREVAIRPASEVAPVDERFDRVIARALAAKPVDRFANCGALASAARLAIAPRRGWKVPVGVGVGLALVGGAGALVLRGGSSARASFPDGPITSIGGCASAPVLLDDQTLAFDLSEHGGAADLYRLRVGGAPEQLTQSADDEWRPNTGASPGELVYLDHDLTDDAKSRVAALDLATGTSRTIAPVSSPGVAAAGGVYYYVAKRGTEIRRASPGRDDKAFDLPSDAVAQLLVASHDGRLLATSGRSESIASRDCIVELATGAMRCPDLQHPFNSRPAFAADDRSLYYPSTTGVRRYWLDGSRDDLVVPNLRVPGGLTVSSSGQIVYSTCEPRGPLVDVSVSPPAALGTDDILVQSPSADVAGDLVYIRARTVVVLRAGGFVREVGGLAPDVTVNAPALAPDGKSVAVAVTGQGIEVLTVDQDGVPNRLTSNGADSDPAWIAPDELVFGRTEDGAPHVYRVKTDGTPARRAFDADRLVIGAGPEGVLLASVDEKRLFWWDPASGVERAGPPLAIGDEELFDAALSPDGRWLVVQRGRHGGTTWRTALDAHGDAAGDAEQVWSKPDGATVSSAAITDEGHVVLVVYEWKGELVGVHSAR